MKLPTRKPTRAPKPRASKRIAPRRKATPSSGNNKAGRLSGTATNKNSSAGSLGDSVSLSKKETGISEGVKTLLNSLVSDQSAKADKLNVGNVTVIDKTTRAQTVNRAAKGDLMSGRR